MKTSAPTVNQSNTRKIVVREKVGATAHLLHHRPLSACDIRILKPQVVFVLSGIKRVVYHKKQSLSANAGDLIVIPGGHFVDLHNEPASGGCYEAISLGIDQETIEYAARLHPETTPIQWPLLVPGIGREFGAAVMRARNFIIEAQQVPPEIAKHAMLELLVWLATFKRRLKTHHVSSFTDQLRALLTSAPHLAWRAGKAARAMAVSEATLRRRLTQHQQSFSELLLDVRLVKAITLLQATEGSILEVALACGFKNHSHFSRVFKARFGFAPSDTRLPPVA